MPRDSEKNETPSKAMEHLRMVRVERSCYRSMTDACRWSIHSHFTESGVFQPPPLSSRIPANSKDIKTHYSFDYAQMVGYYFSSLHVVKLSSWGIIVIIMSEPQKHGKRSLEFL